MKKIIVGADDSVCPLCKKVLTICLLLVVTISTKNIYAEETNNISNDEIINQQQQELGISDFINKANEYTKNTLEEIDIKEIFNSAITGRIGNTNIFNNILNIFGKEFKSIISTIRYSTYNNYNT